MLENMGTSASCLPAGRRAANSCYVASEGLIQMQSPLLTSTLTCLCSSCSSQQESRIFGKSPRNGCMPALHKASLSLPTAA